MRESEAVDDATVCGGGKGVCGGLAKFSDLRVRRGKGRSVLLPTAAACGSAKVKVVFSFYTEG